jgi:hypothetical protein
VAMPFPSPPSPGLGPLTPQPPCLVPCHAPSPRSLSDCALPPDKLFPTPVLLAPPYSSPSRRGPGPLPRTPAVRPLAAAGRRLRPACSFYSTSACTSLLPNLTRQHAARAPRPAGASGHRPHCRMAGRGAAGALARRALPRGAGSPPRPPSQASPVLNSNFLSRTGNKCNHVYAATRLYSCNPQTTPCARSRCDGAGRGAPARMVQHHVPAGLAPLGTEVWVGGCNMTTIAQ